MEEKKKESTVEEQLEKALEVPVGTESISAIIRLDLLRNYKLSWLPGDLVSGLIIFAVTIPAAVAYSYLAGLKPINGLYASLLAMAIFPLLGTARQIVVDAEDTVAILVGSTLAIVAAGASSERYLALAMMQAILAGSILIIAGLFGAGFIADFIPKTVITGFLNGMALIMIASQLGKMTGVKLEKTDFFPRLWEFYAKMDQTNQLILIVGLTCLIGLLLFHYLLPRIPGAIPVVVLATVAVVLLDLGDRGLELVGTVQAGLPQLTLPDVEFKDILRLLPYSAGIALIAYFDVMSTAQAFAFKNRYEIDPNQDMIALGVANVGSGFFQGFGCGCSQSRSAINLVYGGKSQFASLVAAGLLALFLLKFTHTLKNVPVSALTAIIVMAAISIFDPVAVYRTWRTRPASAYLSISTTLAVLIAGLMTGILVAVALAIIMVLHRLTRPHEIISRPPEAPSLLIYRFAAPLFFFNANYFATRVHKFILAARPQINFFLVNAEAIVDMDETAADMLLSLYNELKSRGIVLGICEAKGHFKKVLLNSRLPDREGFNLYPSVADVVEEMVKQQTGKEQLEKELKEKELKEKKPKEESEKKEEEKEPEKMEPEEEKIKKNDLIEMELSGEILKEKRQEIEDEVKEELKDEKIVVSKEKAPK